MFARPHECGLLFKFMLQYAVLSQVAQQNNFHCRFSFLFVFDRLLPGPFRSVSLRGSIFLGELLFFKHLEERVVNQPVKNDQYQ